MQQHTHKSLGFVFGLPNINVACDKIVNKDKETDSFRGLMFETRQI